MVRDGYDVAQICLNGHLVNDSTREFPEDAGGGDALQAAARQGGEGDRRGAPQGHGRRDERGGEEDDSRPVAALILVPPPPLAVVKTARWGLTTVGAPVSSTYPATRWSR